MSESPPGELLAEINALAAAFPMPHPSWHGYVREMHACLADLKHALDAARSAPEVLDLVARAVDGELEQGFDAATGPALAAAYLRLGRLPIPAGEHPYLDEIVPTLEALEALLVAVSLVPAAADAFREEPHPTGEQ